MASLSEQTRKVARAHQLVGERRYEEAADLFLTVLPDRPTRVGELSPEVRRAALHAGICYARAGKTRMAVGLFSALGERSRASILLERAGRKQDARRVQEGHPVPGSPWPPGVLTSRLHERQATEDTGAVREDPLALADRLARTDRPHEALAALLDLSTDHRRYPEAVGRIVRLVKAHGLMSFTVDRFVEPFVRQQGKVVHNPAHLGTLYALGELFEGAGLDRSASRAWRAVAAIDPSYRDASRRARQAETTAAPADVDFGRVLDEDMAFAAADESLRRGPPSRRRGGELDRLPSLPDLPPVAMLPSHPGTVSPTALTGPDSDLDETSDLRRRGPVDDLAATVTGAELPAVSRRDPDDSTSKSEELGLGPVSTGDIIARRYRIESLLGEGGMAVVYKVTDLELEEEVALKLFTRRAEDERAVARFKQEMRIARRLSHPNIVRTYEFGTWRKVYFITMEMLEGHDLEHLLEERGGTLPIGLAVRLFRQGLEGLGAAHAEGIVHRDVKPANMFVLRGAKDLKLMDFGIAKAADATSGHTATGSVVGTPAFIAPERLRGKTEFGAAGDLYAMGVVMYRALTGVLPFVGSDVASLFMQVLEKEPAPPSSLNPDLSRAVDRVIMRLMAKDPRDRYGSCGEARGALDEAWDDLKRLDFKL
jgi:eukaryotic-like serine/threonine-protein kinase